MRACPLWDMWRNGPPQFLQDMKRKALAVTDFNDAPDPSNAVEADRRQALRDRYSALIKDLPDNSFEKMQNHSHIYKFWNPKSLCLRYS